MSSAKERLSQRLKDLRASKQYSQQQMADELGVSRMAYRYYELAERTPDIEFLVRLHQYTNYPYEYLLGDTNNDTYATLFVDKEIGLSTDSIEQLKNNPDIAYIINALLENEPGRALVKTMILQLFYLKEDVGIEKDADRTRFMRAIYKTMSDLHARKAEALLLELSQKIGIPEIELFDPAYGMLKLLMSHQADKLKNHAFRGDEDIFQMIESWREGELNAKQEE